MEKTVFDHKIESPCIGVCSYSECGGYCLGCYRTPEEISGWTLYTVDERKKVVASVEHRKKYYGGINGSRIKSL
jgi:predicted Fe-S protein YdhL (DUF1289 family)